MDIQKILKIVAILIGLLSITFLATIISVGDDAIKAGESSSSVSTLIYLAYLVISVALVLVVVFTLLNIAKNTANFKNTLVGVGAFIGISLLSYALSDGAETPLKDGEMLSAFGAKLVGAGLRLFYLLAFIAAGTMLFFGVKKTFNK